MLTARIFSDDNYNKILFIKELNDSMLLSENTELTNGNYQFTEEEFLNLLYKETDKDCCMYKEKLDKLMVLSSSEFHNGRDTYIEYTLCLHPSRTCNLACKYCFAQEETGIAYLPQEATNFETAKKGIDFLINDFGKKGYKYKMDVSGSGEPLLNLDFIKKLEDHCNKTQSKTGKGIYISFATNATLITPEIAEYLNGAQNIFLGISLDGNEKHSENRLLQNGAEAFSEIIRGVKLLNRPFGIAVTITHSNEDVDKVYDYLYNEFPLADSISMQFIRNYEQESDVSFYKINYENLLSHYRKLADNLLIHINNNDFNYVLKLIRGVDIFGKYFLRVLKTGSYKNKCCDGGIGYMSIDNNGKIYSCSVFNGNEDFEIGDLDYGINAEKQKIFRTATVNNNKKCNNCWGAYICGGECFAKAYITNGNIYDPNEKLCDLKLELMEVCIAFLERLKKENPKAYSYFKNFKVDRNKLDSSLWAANYYLRSRGIETDYSTLCRTATERNEFGFQPEQFIHFTKAYKNDFAKYEINDVDSFKNLNYPVIAFANKFKIDYRYFIINGIDDDMNLKITGISSKDSKYIACCDFMEAVSDIVLY